MTTVESSPSISNQQAVHASRIPGVERLEQSHEQSSCGIPVVPFAVELASSTLRGLDEPDLQRNMAALVGNNGVVGTILFLENSIIVWVGWGKVQVRAGVATQMEPSSAVGKAAPYMGPLVVAMPRTSYVGAFGGSGADPSCSTLIGSEMSEDPLLASQMASRLSVKSGRAVLVSCQLQRAQQPSFDMSSPPGVDNDWATGLDHDMVAHRAAAAAERVIWKIIRDRQEEEEQQPTKV